MVNSKYQTHSIGNSSRSPKSQKEICIKIFLLQQDRYCLSNILEWNKGLIRTESLGNLFARI